MILRDTVELVAVQNEQQPPVDCAMNRLPGDHDVPELRIAEAAEVLVVVARHEGHQGPRPRLREHGSDDVAVDLRPMGGALEPPEIDDVTDQVQELAVVTVEKLQQFTRLTVARAEVGVTDPDRAIVWAHAFLLSAAAFSRRL